jgi:thiamine pyrophosphate-dependent acetolactate synthase large subunit-like protein
MNGAEGLVRTLVVNGVDVCFTNPGTSEMHFVAALDKVEGMRCVLGLFEGVVTGAADGYYRMAGKPACTLLHLGPGLGNGLANLHNAKKARSGIVNIVGEHATYHLKHDAPLTADIAGTPGQRANDMLTIDRPNLDWVSLARGHGVEGGRATTLEELARELQRGFAHRGPYLVELVL